jgi:hypothetical protein
MHVLYFISAAFVTSQTINLRCLLIIIIIIIIILIIILDYFHLSPSFKKAVGNTSGVAVRVKVWFRVRDRMVIFIYLVRTSRKLILG